MGGWLHGWMDLLETLQIIRIVQVTVLPSNQKLSVTWNNSKMK